MNAESVWSDSGDLKSAVHQWAERMSVTVREVHLRDMRRKWASISTTGRLTLSTELLRLPVALGEFVIVHELVHLLARIMAGCFGVSCTPISRIGRRASEIWRD